MIIYRIRRADVEERLNDCLYVMSLLDPTIFSSRDRVRLRRNASAHLAVELSGDRLSELVLRYALPDRLVQIDDEWVLLAPAEPALAPGMVRRQRGGGDGQARAAERRRGPASAAGPTAATSKWSGPGSPPRRDAAAICGAES